MSLPICPFDGRCYRKNPRHWEEMGHVKQTGPVPQSKPAAGAVADDVVVIIDDDDDDDIQSSSVEGAQKNPKRARLLSSRESRKARNSFKPDGIGFYLLCIEGSSSRNDGCITLADLVPSDVCWGD
jgi:hypothetical protein